MNTVEYKEYIKKYSKECYKELVRKPDGNLKYPFLVPGSQSYNNSLWDWDSWLTDIAIRQIIADNGDDIKQFEEYERGCILNFIEYMDKEGRIPISIMPDEMMPELNKSIEKSNIHKPCLIQHIAFIVKESDNDVEWISSHYDKLKRFIEYYDKEFYHKETGLYFWYDDLAIGVDNDPCTFYRPNNSSASIYLNCLMYKELQAMDYISRLLDKTDVKYSDKAKKLKASINEYLWDERNGYYYSADLNLKPIDTTQWLHSGMPRHWSSVIQKIDSWSGFLTMWAGITDEERAKRIVKENMLNEKLFCGKYGIRTLAKTEQMYCLVKSGNPSCWLGPVWGISSYMCYRGLLNYKYDEEADLLAEKTISMFGKDLKENGLLHEYYNPETGEGMNNPGFQSWNLLVNNMIARAEGRKSIREF